jgi:hypothetical protein
MLTTRQSSWGQFHKTFLVLIYTDIGIFSLVYRQRLCCRDVNYSGWKPTHLASVFSPWTSVLSLPDGTTLTAFTNVIMDVMDVR